MLDKAKTPVSNAVLTNEQPSAVDSGPKRHKNWKRWLPIAVVVAAIPMPDGTGPVDTGCKVRRTPCIDLTNVTNDSENERTIE